MENPYSQKFQRIENKQNYLHAFSVQIKLRIYLNNSYKQLPVIIKQKEPFIKSVNHTFRVNFKI